jgi:hypothetical protein
VDGGAFAGARHGPQHLILPSDLAPLRHGRHTLISFSAQFDGQRHLPIGDSAATNLILGLVNTVS